MPVTIPSSAIGTFRSLARMVRDNWILLHTRERFASIGIAICSLASSVVELAALSTVVPFVGLLIDPSVFDRYPFVQTVALQFGITNRHDLFLALGVGVIISLIIGFVFRTTTYLLIERFGMRFTNRISAETLSECLSAPYVWLRSQNGPLLAQRITLDVPAAAQDLYPEVLEILYGVFILLLGTAIILATSSWQAIIVILGIAAISLAVLAFLNPRSAHLSTRMRDCTLTGNRLAVEIFSGRKHIKASQSEKFFIDRYLSVFESGTSARMRLNLVNSMILPSTLLIGQIGIITLALTFVLSDFTVNALVAQLTFILLVLTRVLPSVSSMTRSINKLINTEPFFRGFLALRSELAPWRNQSSSGIPDIGDSFVNWQRITLAGVEFNYSTDDGPQIRGTNVTIERGQNIGIAGPSGAGKSTLVDLILGLLPPDCGQVLIDHQPLNNDNRDEWLAMTGYVPQDPYMMNDSLRRNIAFGTADAKIDDRKIWIALKQAQLKELVLRWPDKLDTMLGEDGNQLSGGQRQRVALARVLYRGTKILVLDEATNALDTETEQTVNKMVRAISGLTSIVITHRLVALRECDRILLMDGGQLVADGRFTDLAENNTLFSRLLLETEQPSEHEADVANVDLEEVNLHTSQDGI